MRSSLTFRALGALLVIVPFLPLRALFGEAPGTHWLLSPGDWLLGLFVFGALAWLLALFFRPGALWAHGMLTRLARWPSDGVFRLVAVLALAAILFLTSTLAFSRTPLLIDSMVQLFQAKIFAQGHLVAPIPPFEAFFSAQHLLVDANGWYSQYPPGHSALLALGVLVGAPWLVPIALTLGTALLLHAFARRVYDVSTARLTLGLLVFSPFFWFMGASYMNHVPTLFFLAAFLVLFARWEAELRPGWIGLAGVALGLAFLMRPVTAIAVGAVFLPIGLRVAGRRWARAAFWGAGGFAVCAGIYLLYNAGTTGDPFTPGYLKLWGADHGLGFHDTPWGDRHTPLVGLRNELIDLSLLNSFLFEWPIPALLPVGLAFSAGWTSRSWDRRLLVAFLAIPAAYFFYWHRDAFLGPRYLYGGLAMLIPLTARSLVVAYRRLGDRSLLPGRRLGEVPASGLLTLLLLLCVGYGILYAARQRFEVYRSGMASLKRDLAAEARNAGIEDGLVFVAVSWGNRMIARLREIGVSASLTETVYRRADHCELEELLRRAERERWSASRLERELPPLMRAPERLEKTGELNGDVTLRLASRSGLTAACTDELLYDQPTYTVFAPHLVANQPGLSGRLIFARDLRARNAVLRSRFPDKPAYLYRPGRFEPLTLDAGSADREK